MRSEDDLKRYLHELTGLGIYSQTPSNTLMKYPCIRVKKEPPKLQHADNKIYLKKNRYTLTHMYKNPEGSLEDILLESLNCISFENRSVYDGLYNDTYDLYW